MRQPSEVSVRQSSSRTRYGTTTRSDIFELCVHEGVENESGVYNDGGGGGAGSKLTRKA